MEKEVPEESWQIEYEAMALHVDILNRIKEIEDYAVNNPAQRIELLKQAIRSLEGVMRVYEVGNIPDSDMWEWITTVRNKIFKNINNDN